MKSRKSNRLPKAQYLELEARLCQRLHQVIDKKRYRLPRFWAAKKDFGDLDLLLGYNEQDPEWATIRENLLTSLPLEDTEESKGRLNGFFEGFPVDILLFPEESLDMATHYLSFPEVGHLLGRIAHGLGLDLNPEGLYYTYRREDGQYKRPLLLSRDFPTICQFFGLSARAWQNGFAKPEEMFAWITASPYFSSKPYKQPATELKQRLEQRPQLQAFRDYLQKNRFFRPGQSPEILPHVILLRLEKFFPESQLRQFISQEQYLETKAQEIYQKFNKKLVQTWLPDLSKETLSDFLTAFKQQHVNFKAYIRRSNAEQICEDVKAFYEGFGKISE